MVTFLYFTLLLERKKIKDGSRTDTKLNKCKYIHIQNTQYFFTDCQCSFAFLNSFQKQFHWITTTARPGKWHYQSHSNVNEITRDNVKQQMLRYPIQSGVNWFWEKLHLNQNLYPYLIAKNLFTLGGYFSSF